jgi:subtilisin-like proprotein convertase family protein
LNKFSHENIRDVNMLLIDPAGRGVVLFSHVSGNRHCTNVTVFLTDNSTYPLPADFDLWSEPLRPTDLSPEDDFPGAPAGPYSPPVFSSFRGLSPNGDWSLYVYDDMGANAGSISGGWSMLITTVAAPTISSIADQTTTPGTGLPAIPFTIGDADTPLSALQVARESSDATIVREENIVLSGSGDERSVTVTPLPGAFGTTRITLTVSDDLASASSSFFLTVTQASSGTLSFANPELISIPALGRAEVYPSTIEVSRAKGTIGKLAVIINSMEHTYPADLDMLLVGPQGQRAVLFSDAGQGPFAITGTTITLDDDAAQFLPELGRISSGTFRPTNYEPGESGDYDSWPEAPDGSTNSVLSVYHGLSPNGTWSLYIVDDGPGDTGALNGGWRLLMDVIPGPADILLTSIVRLENGFRRVRGSAEPGFLYLIQTSSDLSEWNTLGTALADEGGAFELDDTSAETHLTRFYRAVTAPSP